MKTFVGEITDARRVAEAEELADAEDLVGDYMDTSRPEGSGRPSSPPVSAVGEVFMRVRRQRHADGSLSVMLVEDEGEPIAVVSRFLGHLAARDCSPNTLVAYAYDLRHLWMFLADHSLAWQELRPRHALDLLEYLRALPSRRPRQRLSLTLATRDPDGPATQLAPGSVNRILAAVSSFYEYALLAGLMESVNPIEQRPDPALARVADRHRPFMGSVSQQRPLRRSVRVKTIQRVPRPLDDGQIEALLNELRSLRDRALILLMLQGGLRPGEALGLHLEDVAYGRRRIVVRHRTDHPRGIRPKSRTERVVDLHEPETLATLSAYVIQERPVEAETPLVFLVGGHGHRRCEPLSYDGLARLFARACERAEIREAWVTPHTLRHTHATRMWEGGMRELTLQKRLGHASPESTRLYTRVSDPVVVAEYRRALGQASPQGTCP
jgi:integrase